MAEAPAELRSAVTAYEQYLGHELPPNQPIPLLSAEELRQAQKGVEAAEDRLWQLREQPLGWVRPPWAPRASLVADWFSDEDGIYDQVDDSTES